MREIFENEVGELLRGCVEAGTFAHAFKRVSRNYEWADVEPFAEVAWHELSRCHLSWRAIRLFVWEVWSEPDHHAPQG